MEYARIWDIASDILNMTSFAMDYKRAGKDCSELDAKIQVKVGAMNELANGMSPAEILQSEMNNLMDTHTGD